MISKFHALGIPLRKNMIMKILSISILFCCSIQAQTPEFYRKADIEYKGCLLRYPIDSILAKSVNCYRAKYDSKGRIYELTYLKDDQMANSLYNDKGKNFAQLSIEYSDSGEIWRQTYLDGRPAYSDTNFAYIFYRNINGRVYEIIAYDSNGVVVKDSSNIYRTFITFDNDGRMIRVYSLDAKGDAVMDNDGEYEIRLSYDNMGNVIERDNYSANNELLDDKNGMAITKLEYDNLHNVVQISFFNSKHQPVMNSDLKTAVLKTQYDSVGNITYLANYGLGDSHTADENNLRMRTTAAYDEKGNRRSINIDIYDSTSDTRNIQMWYNEAGYKTKTIAILNGKNPPYATRLEIINDEMGKEISETYYDKDGNIIK